MWGTPPLLDFPSAIERFIPACVGNSATGTWNWLVYPVHPRVCGELCNCVNKSCRCPGSSPRVWGTRPEWTWWTIPRSTGSSPRVWGTLQEQIPVHQSRRFIPACVGNSGDAPSEKGNGPVHPRVCGELVSPATHVGVGGGSSPRVWGTLDRHELVGHGSRFIPACVGNSWEVTIPPWGSPVHPRVCGELSWATALSRLRNGSSPRVWGTPGQAVITAQGCRFIPACVGNSPYVDPDDEMFPVHPRVCGELASRRA